MKCPVCDRPLEGASKQNINEHHLMPKTFGGRDKFPLHRICHTKIHSLFTERELKNYYHTWERIREHEEMQKFIKWVEKKDPDFYDSSRRAQRRR